MREVAPFWGTWTAWPVLEVASSCCSLHLAAHMLRCVASPTESLKSGSANTTAASDTNRAQVLSPLKQDSQPGTVLKLPADSTADWLRGCGLRSTLGMLLSSTCCSLCSPESSAAGFHNSCRCSFPPGLQFSRHGSSDSSTTSIT